MLGTPPRAKKGEMVPGWFSTVRRWRYAASATIDVALWFVTLYLAALARLSFEPSAISGVDYFVVAVVAAAAQLTVGYVSGLYRGHRVIGSFSEVLLVVTTSAIAGSVALGLVLVGGAPSLLPISAVLAATAYQMLASLGVRYSARLYVEVRSRSRHHREHSALVFGAGEAGEQIVRALQRDDETDLEPVAFLDDDPTKQRLRIHSVPVVGNRDSIHHAARDHDADTLIIALTSQPQAVINDVADAGLQAGLRVKILPSLRDLSSSSVSVGDIRDLELSDFLDRDEVEIDGDLVRSLIAGQRVLVTGAGGSIGSELCRSIKAIGPERLTMVDHDENALHALQLSLEDQALLTSEDLVLGDIRDSASIRTVFETHRPQVVFHTAAHKHVTFLERFPSEAQKTNVEGTRNVLDAAAAVGVSTFVNISTDKAADPVSVLGKSKRRAEMLTAECDSREDGTYMSVRFGNVLGSNGSVINTFVSQIEAGVPITVTHPEAKRFFMTVREAVLLVLQAGALGEGGDVLVLDMGTPIRIRDLAVRLSRRLRPNEEPTLVFTGLRPGEKLEEVLIATGDHEMPAPHPRLQRFLIAKEGADAVRTA